ncbi:type IV secretory system conjugative DNA transfer family protein [Tyzzerella sp. OttesenSCG-928-J15]|nr:type IV secretory system conjugative DNA transfer family protein [Tyzzerella sp. OttesenSCG-928-J15]
MKLSITPALKKYVMPNLPYAMVFWFANKLGLAYRLTPGEDVMAKVLGVMKSLNEAMANPLPSFNIFDLLVGAVGAAIIYAVVYSKKKNAKKYRKDVEYGSARWGTEKDIKPYVDPVPEQNIILTATESLTMNSRPKNPKYARNKNVLVIGGSGSGKTRFFAKPNLMQLHSSYVVTDPKGQILVECGKLMERNRYRIKVLNTINFSKSMKYNPFQYIHSETDILTLVTTFMANTTGEQKGGDGFWEKAEALLYAALIAYIHYEAPPAEQHFGTLCDFIGAMEVREDDDQFENAVDLIFKALAEEKPGCFAVRQYQKYKLAAGKTAKSILISCAARLAPFDIAEVRELLSYDELDLDTIGDEKTALFVIISDTNPAFNFIPAMMYSQMFNVLCDKAGESEGGRLKIHVRCILDEFANVGKIPNFEQLIATIRSREISACVILQSQSQLKGLYKDHAPTIVGNMDTTLFLGGKEKETLKEISELLGKETVDMYNTSITRSNQTSHGQNFSKLGKDLMSVDELAVMDGGKCICMVRGERPFLSQKFDLLKHSNYKYLSDADKRNAFNIDKYLSTRLRTKQEDVFEVYEMDVSDLEEQQV